MKRKTKRARGLRVAVVGGLSVLMLSGCGEPDGTLGGTLNTGDVGEEISEAHETSPIALTFEEAANAYNVPVDILKAISFIQTGVEPAVGDIEFDNQPQSFGLFALQGEELETAARLSGHTTDRMLGEDAADIEGVAALLSRYAEEEGVRDEDRADPNAWKPAIMRFGDFADDLKESFAKDVLAQLSAGVAIPMPDGTTLVIRRHRIDGEIVFEPSNPNLGVSRGELGQSGTLWRPSPNYSSRGGVTPHFVIIHSCEGSYYGCASWLRNSRAGASAHYVVKENGAEVQQLVDERNKAWHVAANYRSHLNGGTHASYNGRSVNTMSVGIEHGGFARQSSWSTGLINRSVALVRGITSRWNITRDRYHVVAHGRLQPESRTDPGPNWPWSSYISRIAAGSSPAPGPGPAPAPTASTITVDNTTSGRFSASGNWGTSAWASGRFGANYRYRNPVLAGDAANYKFNVATAGRYEVFARIPGNGYSNDAPYVIHHAGGTSSVRRNISKKGGQWVSLGTYSFNKKDDWIVQVSAWTNGSGYVIADAIRLDPK